MFVVTVTFVIKSENLDDFMAAMIRQAHNSLTREQGCLQFDVLTDGGKPDQVFLYELYTDRAAFDRHLASAHFQVFDKAVADMIASKDIQTWERVTQ